MKADIIKRFSKIYNCSIDQVEIIRIEEGSTKVTIKFCNDLNKILKENFGNDPSELEDKFLECTREMLIERYK